MQNFNSALQNAKNAVLQNNQFNGVAGAAANPASATANTEIAKKIDMATYANWPVGNMFSVKIVSTAGVGSAPTRVYLLQQDDLLNVTDNGSGAGSIAYTWSDTLTAPGAAGTTGGVVTSKILRYGLSALGLMLFGLKFRFIVTASSAGDPTGLETCAPYFAQYSFYPNFTPTNITFPDDTRGDFDTSIEVAPGSQFLNAITQLSLVIPDGDTVTVQFLLTPSFKK